jgi:hypothetical protein
LPPPAFGLESIAFESPGGAFYTGVSDGHIFKYQPLTGWTVFAFTSPNRTLPRQIHLINWSQVTI